MTLRGGSSLRHGWYLSPLCFIWCFACVAQDSASYVSCKFPQNAPSAASTASCEVARSLFDAQAQENLVLDIHVMTDHMFSASLLKAQGAHSFEKIAGPLGIQTWDIKLRKRMITSVIKELLQQSKLL